MFPYKNAAAGSIVFIIKLHIRCNKHSCNNSGNVNDNKKQKQNDHYFKNIYFCKYKFL